MTRIKTAFGARAAMLLGLMAVATLCLAQTSPQTMPQTPPPDAEPPALEVEARAQDLAGEPIAAEAGQNENVLEDYEASEQISEDLSVSFPVDI